MIGGLLLMHKRLGRSLRILRESGEATMEACTTSGTMPPMSGGQALATTAWGKTGHTCFMECGGMMRM
ncbi:hypothetical protein ACFTQL_25580 [Peribacillus butanolivorans]|uniref:hypothetical protein n=1 Tax=Peribacillus butanolivorans TaxID=421767 RepID=UPI003639064B